MEQRNPNSIRRIYHGTTDSDFKPFFGGGRDYHDYGKGLYCTEDFNAAKEWACQNIDVTTAYVYEYDLLMEGIDPTLNLNILEPLYWLAVLAQYRYGQKESSARRERRLRLIELFNIDCEQYEIIEGWRADDRYFTYLSAFLGLDISYEAVILAMKLGDLGQQVVIKGKTAYDHCRFVGKTTISGTDYFEHNSHYLAKAIEAEKNLRGVRDIPGIMLDEILERGGV